MRYYQFCIRTKVQEASGVGGGGGLAIPLLVSVSVFTKYISFRIAREEAKNTIIHGRWKNI